MAEKIMAREILPSMRKRIRILFVEDSEDDAQFLVQHLRAASIEPDIRCVASEQELVAALGEGCWDLVLSDNLLPGFSGIDALRCRNVFDANIPFITLAGDIEQHKLVELIYSGADGVINKRDLYRLVPIIERAMRDGRTRRENLRIQEALRQSEERYRSLVDLAPDGVMITTRGDVRIVFANRALLEMFGAASVDQVVGRSAFDFVHPDDCEMVMARSALVFKEGRSFDAAEIAHVRLDGSTIATETRSALIDWDGEPAKLVMLRDVSARKKAQEALRESENYLRTIIENSVDGILTFDEDLIVHTCNPPAGRIFGRDIEEIVGNPLESFIVDDVKDRISGASTILPREARGWRHDGTTRAIEYSVNEMRVAGRRMFTCLVRDVTELKESEQRYRSVVDLSPDGIMVVQDGKLVFANPAFGQLWGERHVKRLIGRTGISFYHESSHDLIHERRQMVLTKRRALPSTEMRMIRKDGSELPCEARSCYITWKGEPAILIVCRDVTERKRSEDERRALEQQLRQSHKMEALGTLAGGTAHEFNNLLQPIMLLTELVLREVPEGSQAFRNLNAVLQNSRRAAQLVDKILSFSHRDERRRGHVDLRETVRDGLELLEATLPATIEIRCHLDAAMCCVLADPTEMQQVLINLASNAAHAMEGRVGALTVDVQRITLDRTRIGRHARIEPGRFVRLSVSDTGVGMDEHTMNRIFEPFFTTKDVGEGTGLGLSMIHGIVTAHGGGIEVSSRPGKGTTFEILLPLAEPRKPALAVNG